MESKRRCIWGHRYDAYQHYLYRQIGDSHQQADKAMDKVEYKIDSIILHVRRIVGEGCRYG